MELFFHFLVERSRLVKCQHIGIGIQDLFQQRGAAAGMPAEKGNLIFLPGGGRFLPPAPEHFRRQPCKHLTSPPVAIVVAIFQ